MVADAAGALASPLGAHGLRGVFDHRNAAGRGALQDRTHIGAAPIKMDRQNGLDRGMRRERVIQVPDVQVERVRLNIDENRPRTGAHDGPRCGKKREGDGEHFVAGPNIGGHQSQFQRIGAGGAADRVTRAAIVGEALLEALDFRAQDEALRFDHARESSLNRLAQRLVLARQIEQGNGPDTLSFGFDCHSLQSTPRSGPATNSSGCVAGRETRRSPAVG